MGRTARVVSIANRWRASNSNPPIPKAAFGNNEERLSLSNIIYSTQHACTKIYIHGATKD